MRITTSHQGGKLPVVVNEPLMLLHCSIRDTLFWCHQCGVTRPESFGIGQTLRLRAHTKGSRFSHLHIPLDEVHFSGFHGVDDEGAGRHRGKFIWSDFLLHSSPVVRSLTGDDLCFIDVADHTHSAPLPKASSKADILHSGPTSVLQELEEAEWCPSCDLRKYGSGKEVAGPTRRETSHRSTRAVGHLWNAKKPKFIWVETLQPLQNQGNVEEAVCISLHVPVATVDPLLPGTESFE
mmetsp:Transcript_17390/g.26257  ORF Transcript_17390/g.26257 Transcript_17390/m.26257 type:complete len:237 (-) Transcript_17390:34-744(-)